MRTELKSISERNIQKVHRELYLDILRVIACFAVVLIHVSAPFVVDSTNQFDFWMGNIIDSMARVGVPLFVMISGALFLDKNNQYSKGKIVRHISKMMVFFIVWSLFYCLFSVAIKIIKNDSIDIFELVVTFFKGHYHLWFVPMIIGLYLITPLLKLWVNKENKKYVEYFLFLSILFSFVFPYTINIFSKIYPQVQYVNDIVDSFYMYYPAGFSSYFILGWYLNTFYIKRKKLLLTAGVSGLLITMFGTYLMPVVFGVNYNFYGDFTVNVLIYSIAFFVGVKQLYKNKMYCDCVLHKIIKFICNNSLAIYAMHVLIVDLTYSFFNMHILVKIPLMFILSIMIPVTVAALIRKIPILKKIIV